VTRRGLSTVGNNNAKGGENQAAPNGNMTNNNERGNNGTVIRNDDNRLSRTGAGRSGNYNYENSWRVDDHHNVVRIPPRERDFVGYDRMGAFWGHDPHYYGYRVHSLPPHYHRMSYFGIDYYRYNGIYFRLWNGVYIVVRPPVGIILDTPIVDVVFSPVHFSYYYDVYRTYRGFDSYSRYIDNQNRIIANNNAIIAQQNAQIALNQSSSDSSYDLANQLGLAQSYAYADKEYFYQDGVFYIVNASGQYQTITAPAGALVEELPDDFDTITLGNAEYYRVDDTVFRVVVISGHPYFEVLGQMYGNMAKRYSQFS